MKGKFEGIKGKRCILRILAFFVAIILGVTGHLRGVEGALTSEIEIEGEEFKGLTRSQAEEVKKIWRVIGDQEIVTWDGKEWLAKTEAQKKDAIKKACEAWRKAGYQNIESVEYFVEDIDKYYNHYRQKDPEELKTKVGLVLSLSAFFGGMERRPKDR